MVILGIILALIGWFASISILLWIGVILIIVGLVLDFVPIGGSRRRYYYLRFTSSWAGITGCRCGLAWGPSGMGIARFAGVRQGA